MNLTEIQQIVAPYITSNYASNETKENVFLFDNNQFSGIAKATKKNLTDVQHLLSANYLDDKDIIIPSSVLWETGKNLPNQVAYLNLYQPIFEELSNRSNIYIMTTEEAFNIFSSSYVKKVEAFDLFKSIAVEMNRGHLDLKDELQKVNTIQEFDAVLHSEEDDLGERQAFLIMAALIDDRIEYVEFGSNEHVGVYLKIEDYAMQDDLLRLMSIPDSKTFMELFRVKSLNALVGETITSNITWDLSRIEEFLDTIRHSQYFSSPVIYHHATGGASRKFTNKELSQLFKSFPAVKVLF